MRPSVTRRSSTRSDGASDRPNESRWLRSDVLCGSSEF
jgi:hypothetical protein